MYFSVIILVLLSAFPIAQMLPGVIRKSAQILSVLLFWIGSFATKRRTKNNIVIITLIVFLQLFYFGTWAWHYMTFNQYAFNTITICIFISYGTYILDLNDDYYYYKSLFDLTVFAVIVTAITTIIGLIQYPLSVRELGKTAGYLEQSVRNNYLLHNISTWPQLYGTTFISPFFLLLYRDTHQKKFLLFWICCELMIVASQLTYALLFSFMIPFVILQKKVSNFRQIFLKAFVLTIVAVLIINGDRVLRWLINMFNNAQYSTLASKLYDLYVFLFMGRTIRDAGLRFQDYGMSFSTFLAHPIGGLFLEQKNGGSYLGFHSDVLDIMGYFGIIGLIFLILLSRLYCRYVSKSCKSNKRTYYIIFAFYGLILFLNAMLFSPMVALGVFVLPTLVHKYSTKKLISSSELL